MALATIAIVGSEEVDGHACYWYQVEWQQDRFWIGVPPLEAKAGRQSNWTALIRRDRVARIRLLVDGPQFERIIAYRVKIDAEPEVGYLDQDGAALLPQVPLAEALILPAAEHPYQPAAAPSAAIVVPDGLHIPVGLFWEPQAGEAGKPIDEEYPYWNDGIVGIDPGPALAALAGEVKSLYDARTPFDIVVNDAAWAASGSSPYRHTITIGDGGQVSIDRW